MPFLNSRGDIAAGVGGYVVSLNGTPIASGGGACWLDDDRLIFQRLPDLNVCTYSVRTSTVEVVRTEGAGGTTTPVGGANFIVAGGGVWATWGGAKGFRHSRGYGNSGMGLRGAASDGTIMVAPNYQQGTGLILIRPDGRQVMDLAGFPYSCSQVRLVGTTLTFLRYESQTYRPYISVLANEHLSPPVALTGVIGGNAYWFHLLPWGWRLYQDGANRLLLHRADFMGMVLANGNTFAPDWCVLPDGRIRVVWATSEGEPPTALRHLDVDLATAAQSDIRLLTPPIPIPTPTTGGHVPAVNHLDIVKKWRAYYDSMPPGNERAYQIVNAVAWDLEKNFSETAGLHAKGGNNWNGVSVDTIQYKTGVAFDVLGNSEADATPQWGQGPNLDVSTWRAPVAPLTWPPVNVPPPPTPDPPPPLPPPDSSLTERLARIEAAVTGVATAIQQLDSETKAIRLLIDDLDRSSTALSTELDGPGIPLTVGAGFLGTWKGRLGGPK